MRLMPIVYVTEMARAIEFYTALGLSIGPKGRSGMWTELTCGDATLALHFADKLPEKPVGRVELALVSQQPLETIVDMLRQNDITLYRDITDEAFGRSIMVRDPDGLIIQINEHDETLYT